MTSQMMGIETEYALCLAGASGSPAHWGGCEELMELARRRLPHLPADGGGGMFLENGSRLYQDAGSHPELATCEVDHPDDRL